MISRLGMLLCYFWSDGMIIHGEPSCWCRWCINHCLNDDAPISDTVEFILQFLGGLHRVFPLSKDQDVIRKWQGSAHTRYLVLRDHHGIHVKQIWEQGWALWQFRENGGSADIPLFFHIVLMISIHTDEGRSLPQGTWRCSQGNLLRKEFTSRQIQIYQGFTSREIKMLARKSIEGIYLKVTTNLLRKGYEERIYLEVNTHLLRKAFTSK